MRIPSWSGATNFDGNSVNANNWTFDIGNGSGGWGNNELEYYTTRPENLYVTNGLLHIVARQESYGGKNYTSAKLKTTGTVQQKNMDALSFAPDFLKARVIGRRCG